MTIWHSAEWGVGRGTQEKGVGGADCAVVEPQVRCEVPELGGLWKSGPRLVTVSTTPVLIKWA